MTHRKLRLSRVLPVLLAPVAVLLVTSTAHADFLSKLAQPFQHAVEHGSYAWALMLIFATGLATALTPCVYPMIVITVSVFGARQASTRLQGALLSSCFVLGIAALFTPLGVIAALTGSVFGSALSSPWVLSGLAILFVVLSLSMFGAFEMNLPPALQNRLAQVGGVGYKGAFALGLVSAVIAAPCTGPVVGFLLTWVATTRAVAFGAAAFFAYSLGLGTLFFIVGTFAITLPKSGRWLEWVKSAFGTIMIVMALYFVRTFLPLHLPAERSTTWIAIAGGLAVIGIAAGAIHLSFHGGTMEKVRKGVGVTLAVAGLFGVVMWLVALPPGAKIAWHDDYNAAKALANKEKRPMLVDFGASWCGACGELDRQTFSDPRVVAAAQGFVAVRVDLSPGKDTPDKKALLASYNQHGLPLVVVHDKDGHEAARVTGFMEPEQFLHVLAKVR